MKVRKKLERIRGGRSSRPGIGCDLCQTHSQNFEPANLSQRHPCQHDDHGHFQNKLKQVRDQHAPQAADEGVESSKWDKDQNANHERGVCGRPERIVQAAELQDVAFRDGRPQQDRDDVHHGQRDPAQDHAVHEEAQINGLESTQERSGLAAISQLHQFHVCQDLSAPPIAGEEKHCQHAAQALSPPQPVSGDALPRH